MDKFMVAQVISFGRNGTAQVTVWFDGWSVTRHVHRRGQQWTGWHPRNEAGKFGRARAEKAVSDAHQGIVACENRLETALKSLRKFKELQATGEYNERLTSDIEERAEAVGIEVEDVGLDLLVEEVRTTELQHREGRVYDVRRQLREARVSLSEALEEQRLAFERAEFLL